MERELPSHLIFRSQVFPDLAHGFFTRQGGVSRPPFHSLNVSASVGDHPEDVFANRLRVATHLGVRSGRLVCARQVHGSDVAMLSQASDIWSDVDMPDADAVVSTMPDVAVGVLTADCAPVLIADMTGRVVAAAHAGWRGAAGGVLESTVQVMRKLGAGELRAVIGPCIKQRHYEVGEDMRASILSKDAAAASCFAMAHRPGHYQFDLAGYCARRLRRAGLRHISTVKLDTMGDPQRFFSHRRMTLSGAGQTGRQISAIRAGGAK